MKKISTSHIDIDLGALRHNFRLARRSAGGKALLAVVKADAYGHGAVPVAQTLASEGAELFGVAHAREGEELRNAGIEQPIVLFCGVRPGAEEEIFRLQLTPMLFDLELAQCLDQMAAKAGIRQPVHLKLDTGMGRVGFRPEELSEVLSCLGRCAHLDVEGVASHLARADEVDAPTTARQYQNFLGCLQMVKTAGFSPRWIHLSNSAALYSHTFAACNLLRPGISLYGGLPAPGLADLDLRPVMQVRSSIAQLKRVPVGTGISYGHRFMAQRPTLVAAVPIGYADGYFRHFSNCGEVLIRGQRASVVGRVCMNWTLVDVTDLRAVEVGDRVTFLGCDGPAVLRGSELAAKIDTIDYELYCSLGSHLPRVYAEG